METINTNSLKDKNRAHYERSAKRQDHGTRGTSRLEDSWGHEWDTRGPKNLESRKRIDDVEDGLDDYFFGMTPEELALEADKILLNDESKSIKAELPRKNADLFVPAQEKDIMAELMGSDISPEELSINALRGHKKYHAEQAGREMGDYND